MTSYVAALCDPFSAEAEGAQVPDMYSLPTCTQMIRTAFTLSTNDSSGNLDFVLQPNLFCTIASSTGTGATDRITGGEPWSSSYNFTEHGVSNQTVVAQYFSRYRVVSWGMRLRTLVTPQGQQGKFYIAKVPAINQWANYSTAYTNAAYWSDYLDFYELPEPDATNNITNSIIGLPTATQNMVSALSLEQGLETVGSIVSPVAFEWRDSTQSAIIDQHSTDQPIYQSGQIIAQTNSGTGDPYPVLAMDSDFLRQAGWSCILFKATGLSTTPQPWFDVEVVFHLEGLPPVTNSVIMVPSKNPPVHLGLLNAAIHTAATQPHFKKAINNMVGRGRVVRHGLETASRHLGFRDMSHLLSTLNLNAGTIAGFASSLI